MCQTIAEEATPKDSHGREGSPSCARMDKATQRVPPYPTGRSGDYNLVHAETNLAAGTGGLPALDRATGGCAIRRSQSSQVYAAGGVGPAQRERMRDAKSWSSRRRPEILALYETEVFGKSPAKAAKLNYEVKGVEKGALGGKADRKVVTVYFGETRGGPKMDLLIYLPAGAKKAVPVFLGLSFSGIHAVANDAKVPLGTQWVRGVKEPAPESSRGSAAERWQVEKILAAGYGLATVDYNDIEPDFVGGLKYGIRPLFFKPGQSEPAADEWGAIAAWGWAASRAMDYLEKDKEVDGTRVALFGHSRLGKTALWAGAQDTRFSMVIANESGEGGAAISRRNYGERTQDLNTRFPHWFDGNFKKYSAREDEMPFDSHMLLSLIAPRGLYVASAEEDRWSDPRGAIRLSSIC